MRQQVSVFLSDASTHQTLTAAETEYMTFVFLICRMFILTRYHTPKHFNVKENLFESISFVCWCLHTITLSMLSTLGKTIIDDVYLLFASFFLNYISLDTAVIVYICVEIC